MLLRYEVGNYKSFKEKQIFELFAGKQQKKKERLLDANDAKVIPVSVFYGANAAGKSNFIESIKVSKNIISNGVKAILNDDYYFKNNLDFKEKPTHFEYEIFLNGVSYAYGFLINMEMKKIVGEWLYKIGKEEEMLYEIDHINKKFDHSFKNFESIERLEILFEDILNMENSLFITELDRRKYTIDNEELLFLQKIFFWFEHKLEIIDPTNEIPLPVSFNSSFKEDLILLLQNFDTGITDFKYKEIPRERLEGYIPEDLIDEIIESIDDNPVYLKSPSNLFKFALEDDSLVVHELLFSHGVKNIWYHLGDESDGTKRLIQLIGLLNSDNSDKVFVIDEIDRSIHPKLTYKFIETFLKKQLNTQLIASTHESSLLNQDLLRRDEIWFIDRDSDMSSKIYCLEEFKERFDKDIHKGYLDGRYGAVPIFNDFNCMEDDLECLG